MLCELLGPSSKESSMTNGSLLERIAHLKAAVSALLESSKVNGGVTSNGDLEDVEIVHCKTNGHSAHTMDLTKVEELEVRVDQIY